MKKKSILMSLVFLLSVVPSFSITDVKANGVEFSNDFENEKYYSTAPEYREAYLYPSTSESKFTYIANINEFGGAASHNIIHANGDMYKNQFDEDGNMIKPTFWVKDANDTANFADNVASGGWPMEEGWGFNSRSAPGVGWETAPANGLNLTDLTVVGDGQNPENHVLKLIPATWKTSAERGYSSFFGKDNFNVVGRLTYLKTDVKVVGESEGFRLNIVKNANLLNTDITRQLENPGLFTVSPQFMRASWSTPTAAWYDALTWLNGNIYLGKVEASNVVCAYTAGEWYTVEYYLDLKDLDAPKNIVVIYNSRGVKVGSKSSAITPSKTTMSSVVAQSSDFTAFDDSSSYAYLFSATSKHGEWTNRLCEAYLDNMEFGVPGPMKIENEVADDYVDFNASTSVEIPMNYPLDENTITNTNVKLYGKNETEIPCTLGVDANKIVVRVENLAPATDYVVKISKEIQAENSMKALSDMVFRFRTKNKLVISGLDVTGTGDAATASLSVTNNYNDAVNATVILSVNKTGVGLFNKRLYYIPVQIPQGGTVPLSFTGISVPTGGSYEVSAYAWDSFEGMTALCNYIKINK